MRTVTRTKIGIRDIAAEMDVAVSTVSRALAFDAGVGEARAEMIREYAKNVGYKPKPLRRKMKRAILVVMAVNDSKNSLDNYQRTLLSEIGNYCSKLGLHIQIEFVPQDDGWQGWPAALEENRVDGALLLGHPPLSLCHRISKEGIFAVAVNDTLERTNCSCILVDTTSATTDAVRRLIQLGHKDIGLVITDRRYPTVEMRYQAYCFAMLDSGLKLKSENVIQGVQAGLSGGREGVIRLVDKGSLPTAIVFCNDRMAIGGLIELAERGYRVPDDVSIIGHDNDPMCEELAKTLTTCEFMIKETAVKAIALLQDKISGRISGNIEKKISSSLIWRETCIPPKSAR